MMPAIKFGSTEEWQHRRCMLLSFFAHVMRQQMWYFYKWDDMKLIDSCKCGDTVEWATCSVSTIERVDLKGDLSNLTRILASRSSRGDLPVRISSWRSRRPRHISIIQKWTMPSP
jgi:hypothetical protein